MSNSLYNTCTYIYKPIPAYRIAQMADHRSGKNTTHTYPCLQDHTNGRSPVREKYDTHLSLPTGPHKWQIASPVREKYTHLSLPTGSHKWQIAGQEKIRHIPIPAYRIAQMADLRSGKNTTHTYPCLQDHTNGRSPVREKYDTHLSLPTGPHKWQIAGQGKIHTPIPAYRIAQMADRRSGKNTTHTYPCLQDRTNGRSPVRKKYDTYLSLPTGPHKWQIAGQGETQAVAGMHCIHIHVHVPYGWLHVLLKSISHFAAAEAVAGLITPSLQHTPLIYADCVQPLQVYKAHPKWYAKGRCA